ncbi:MAG: hypothetical protein AB2704_13570 [Candidatus Thiodiazotropha taylori]
MDLNKLKQIIGNNQNYEGPGELAPFAQFLAPIGEVVIAFSRLERRLTWAIESVLNLSIEDANAIQESIYSVSTRTNLFLTIASTHVDNKSDYYNELQRIAKKIHQANDYRNFILHGPWTGVQRTITDGEIDSEAMKVKYAQLGSKKKNEKPRSHSTEEMRQKATEMLILCREIQIWVLSVFPNAQNRVP